MISLGIQTTLILPTELKYQTGQWVWEYKVMLIFVKTVSDSSAERKTEEAIGRIVPVDSLGLLPFACPLCATGAQRFLTEPAIV